MITAVDLACDPDHVKAELRSQVDRALEWLFAVAESGGSARRLEQDVWRSVRALGSTLRGLSDGFGARPDPGAPVGDELDVLGVMGAEQAEMADE